MGIFTNMPNPVIYIKLNESDVLRFKNALLRMKNGIRPIADTHLRECAISHVLLLKDNIVSQKFLSLYAPYSKRYMKWKEEEVGHLKHWQLHRVLYGSLSVFKHGHGWMAGIPKGVSYPYNTSWSKGNQKAKTVAQIGRWLEFGIGANKRRPLFAPTQFEFETRHMPKQLEKARRKIERMWR
jgi:hypothetical protein